MQKGSEYNVYAQGVRNEQKTVYGIGYIIEDKRAHNPSCYSKRLPLRGRLDLSVAKIFAAAQALAKIPPKSLVTVYVDDNKLAETIAEKDFSAVIRRTRRWENLRLAYYDFREAMLRHQEVSVIHTLAGQDESLQRAYNLATQGLEKPLSHEVRKRKPRKAEERMAIQGDLENFLPAA